MHVGAIPQPAEPPTTSLEQVNTVWAAAIVVLYYHSAAFARGCAGMSPTPHSLAAGALSLLMVFRTNSVPASPFPPPTPAPTIHRPLSRLAPYLPKYWFALPYHPLSPRTLRHAPGL